MTATADSLHADLRVRQRILEQALARMADRGLYPGLLAEAASAASISEERARIFFRRDEDLVIALHERLANELEEQLTDLPQGTMAHRFDAVMRIRLAQVAPHRQAFARLLAALLDPEGEHGVLSHHTETVRLRVGSVFTAVVFGATDCPPSPLSDAIARALYAVHLGLLLLWTQDRTPDFASTYATLDLLRDLLIPVSSLAAFPIASHVLSRIDGVLSGWLEQAPAAEMTECSERILLALFRHRRLLPDAGACAETPCRQCIALHLPKVRRFVAAARPVHFVLPAFPAKSPNPTKVLGTHPDRAEELALVYLQGVCNEIRAIYPPGARITICSDGRVFSDLVGVSDDDVTTYGRDISATITHLNMTDIDTFCTEDLFDLPSFDAMRQHLCQQYAESIQLVQQRARDYPHHHAMWSGIHRFLFEDRVAIDRTKSRSQIRKECGTLAHQVIQRSNAWTRLVSDCFPTALRLSIHPQPAHAAKIGIRLMDTEDTWLTPWHGVAVEHDGKFALMRRHEAEQRGAQPVEQNGRPCYMVIREGR